MASNRSHRRAVANAALLAGTLVLAACGGGSGGVNSASSAVPPPPPPAQVPAPAPTPVVQNALAPAPAWTTGNYQGIAVVRDSLNGNVAQAPAGSVSLAVDTAAKTYTLTVSAGTVVIAPTTFGTAASPGSLHAPYIGTTVRIGDNLLDVTSSGFTRPDTNLSGGKVLQSYLAVSSVPGRHVSLGYWSLSEAPLNPDGSRGTTSAWSEGQFVFGDRTLPGDIPASGTARYQLYSPDLSSGNSVTSPLVFEADFGAKTITASYSTSALLDLYPDGTFCCFGGEDFTPDPKSRVATIALSNQLSGTAPFASSGSFDLALAGSGMMHTDRVDQILVADINRSLSGSISGAFFGPQAGELGGTYNLQILGPAGTVSDDPGTFTAVKSGP